MPATNPIPVVLAGATGKTGGAIGRALVKDARYRLVGALSRHHAGESLGLIWGETQVDVVLTSDLGTVDLEYAVLVDFTEPDSAIARLIAAVERGWDIVVGTTGFGADDRERLSRLVEERHVGAAVIANFSLGAFVAELLAKEAARYFHAVEVVEEHHARKKDRPSGTAKVMASVLGEAMKRPADSIPVHSLRLPGLVAHQAVVFGAEGQVLTIRHDVHDRTAYIEGVLAAIDQVQRIRGVVMNDLGSVLESRPPL